MKARTRTTPIAAGLLAVAMLTLFCGCESDEPDFAIAPPAAVLDASTRTNLQLVVSGGVPPYLWDNANRGLGTLAAAGDTAFYSSRPAVGQNTVSVTDANGAIVIVTIEQM